MHLFTTRFKKSTVTLLLGLMLLMPSRSYAETNWKPKTNDEMIAFLYGIVVQLQLQLEALRSGRTFNDRYTNSDRYNYDNDNNNDDESSSSSSGRPRVVTGDIDDITGNAASVAMEIDMRSYGNGTIFLVYGTNRSKVSGATSEDSYDEIELDGKTKLFVVNNSFAGEGELITGLNGLQVSTDYYYRACVEYTDDNSRNDTEIACGDVESFETKKR